MIEFTRFEAEASAADEEFLYRCLLELNDGLVRHRSTFGTFIREALASDAASELLIAAANGQQIGTVTVNRFAMPRYVGFGYEIQEIVVAPAHRSKGFGRQMLTAVVTRYAALASTRKVVVRSNDPASQALYARVYTASDLQTFQQFVHKV